jgi:Sensors of blue-light using FAD
MIQLVYLSSTSGLLSADDIAQILIKSRENNAGLEVTGLLVYKGGNVLQVLEGEREVVLKLYEKIKRDPRHGGVIKLYEKEIEVRDFPDWTMGFYDLDAEGATYLEGFNEILRPGFDITPMKESTALKLVKSFKAGMR